MIVIDLQIILFILLLILLGLIWVFTQYRPVLRGGSQHNEGTLLGALKVAPFGVLMLEDDSILFSNEYALSLLHIPADKAELANTDWLPLMQEDRTSAHKGDVSQGRFRIITFASGKTARWWVIPLYQQDIIFLFDITSQIHTEQTGRALVNDLGHELRTPVATILTHLEILGLDNVGIEAQQQSLELARKEAHRMGRLINDMLELGRLEVSDELPLRAISIIPLVNEVILQSTPYAQEKQMEISLDTDANIPVILGNADRLRQVFLNLVDNAIKYCSVSDRIVIHLKHVEEGIQCSVCDTGPGISPENLPYVTRRFFRAAPESVDGSGLGLALVSEILRRHQSQIKIESPVTDISGTCIHFILPIDKQIG